MTDEYVRFAIEWLMEKDINVFTKNKQCQISSMADEYVRFVIEWLVGKDINAESPEWGAGEIEIG